MENSHNLQNLIDFGIDLLAQMKEFLDSPEIVDEAKEYISTNIVFINSILQTAIHFRGTPEQETKLKDVFSKTLEENYNFLKKLSGH